MKNAGSATRLKLILIPLLGAILLGILCWPESPSDAEPPALSSDRVVRRKNLQAAAASRPTSWNNISRTTAHEFNPFLVPRATSEADEAQHETSESLNAVARQGSAESTNQKVVRVQAIMQVGSSYAALIDGKLVRVGDQLPGGIKVASISFGGVVTESD